MSTYDIGEVLPTGNLDKQKIFDKVAKHLLKQGVPAYNKAGNTCAYRGVNKTKCAIGCLIKDKFYKPGIEGDAVTPSCSLHYCSAATKASNTRLTNIISESLGVKINEEDLFFLRNLQRVHDDISLDDRFTVSYLKERAKELGLKWNIKPIKTAKGA